MAAVALIAQRVVPIATDSPKVAKNPIWMRKCRQRRAGGGAKPDRRHDAGNGVILDRIAPSGGRDGLSNDGSLHAAEEPAVARPTRHRSPDEVVHEVSPD